MGALHELLLAKEHLENAKRDAGVDDIREVKEETEANLAWDYHYGLTESICA